MTKKDGKAPAEKRRATYAQTEAINASVALFLEWLHCAKR